MSSDATYSIRLIEMTNLLCIIRDQCTDHRSLYCSISNCSCFLKWFFNSFRMCLLRHKVAFSLPKDIYIGFCLLQTLCIFGCRVSRAGFVLALFDALRWRKRSVVTVSQSHVNCIIFCYYFPICGQLVSIHSAQNRLLWTII